MRRLRIACANAIDLGRFDRVRHPLILDRQFPEEAALLDHNLIQLLVVPLQMGEVRFNALQSFGNLVVHEFRCRQPGLSRFRPEWWQG